ncbi:MAG: phosphotransferase [Deltaproteobacteria bacterium]|jgi:homoserine kinase type II|nr:phosphotransferase [Deltaproteobacteria bacterium]
METSKMKLIAAIPPEQLEAYRDYLNKSQRNFNAVYSAVESQVLYNQLQRLFEGYYDLGTIKEIYEVFGGYTNRSFGVIAVKDGVEKEYFIRKYKAEATDTDVLMEHGLIEFVIKNGFQEAAGLFRTTDDRSFVRLDELKRGKSISRVFAIYRFLPGADKYTWIDNHSTAEEFRNLGSLLARFHSSGYGFEPDSSQRKTEPKIPVLIPDFKRMFGERSAQPIDTHFHSYFTQALPIIFKHLDEQVITPAEYAALPQCPIHGDYHAGNVKFDGEATVGLYDFDWSKVDVRLFDVCLGLVYCCASWKMETDGQLRLDDCRNFLDGYEAGLNGHKFPPFTDVEKKVFVRMLSGGFFYLIYWLTELWYYLDIDGINNYEAISYLDHFIRGLNWLKANSSTLAGLV